MKFSEMPYSRPDFEEAKHTLAALTDALRTAKDYAGAKDVFMQYEQFERGLVTQRTLASIRHSIDTRDAFYEEEMQEFNKRMPELRAYSQKWNDAMLESPFRPQFEAEFGRVWFLNAELEKKAFSPEIIPQLQQEANLVNEYEKLIASAQIEFEGGVYTMSQLMPMKTCADDERRRNAWRVEGAWLKQQQPKLDELYAKLTALRDEMGRKLGYDNYVPLGYACMRRNCYTRQDVERFRELVCKHVVPLAERIYREQAERTGCSYPLHAADKALTFRSGNPRPVGTAADILEMGRTFYRALSPQTGEFFDTMLDNELLDVLSTPGKRSGGYCTNLPAYRVPFIFANFNGTQGDVEVVTHEAGHAFAGWLNRDRVPMSNMWPSLEGCEVHSMSMEFMAWPWVEGFFGKDAQKYRYSHLTGSLTFLPYGVLVDHFQHEVYDHPEMTPTQRHDTWRRLQHKYMPWLSQDGSSPVYDEGEQWQRQHHIYTRPFYYIDYCFAQTVALSFWAMSQKDFAGAWERYMAYTRQGGSAVFTELLKNAGIESPFEESCLKNVCEEVARYLDGFDKSALE